VDEVSCPCQRDVDVDEREVHHVDEANPRGGQSGLCRLPPLLTVPGRHGACALAARAD
jgi:hypothetical protein